MQDPDRTASLMTPAKLAQVKPAAPPTPAAWLDQMALDAGHAHVRRIADLHENLRLQGEGPGCASLLSGELARLSQVLPLLDFGLLQARGGWWARVSGKQRGGGEFGPQFQRIEEAAQALAAQHQIVRKHQLQTTGTDRTLLELDVESRALDAIIDQGTRWLQDMRNQIKGRSGGDAAARRQIEDDTARCELLVGRLKVLRAIATAAQQARQQAQSTAVRRTALVKMLQHALDRDLRTWHDDVSAIAAGVDGTAAAQDLEAPMASHRDLQLCIKQAVADCAQLHGDEQALAELVAALAGHLHAAS
jgi:hypothetical protein